MSHKIIWAGHRVIFGMIHIYILNKFNIFSELLRENSVIK